MPTPIVYRDWRPDDAANMGFNYTATYQDDATTLRRLQSGQSIVAVADGVIVGTVTLYPPKPDASCAWYTHAHCFGQFGVRPDLQGRGIGRELVRLVEECV